MKRNKFSKLVHFAYSIISLYAGRLLNVSMLLSGRSVDGFSVKNNQNPSLAETGTTKNVATQVLQGVGPIAPEALNAYNLKDLEEIASQWTANLVQKAAEKEAKLQLRCVNDKELFVDTVDQTFPRISGAGLGLELQELAGGREDGLGITIVTSVLSEGAASGADILPGDSISKVKGSIGRDAANDDRGNGMPWV